jgi:hypothetical protein
VARRAKGSSGERMRDGQHGRAGGGKAARRAGGGTAAKSLCKACFLYLFFMQKNFTKIFYSTFFILDAKIFYPNFLFWMQKNFLQLFSQNLLFQFFLSSKFFLF